MRVTSEPIRPPPSIRAILAAAVTAMLLVRPACAAEGTDPQNASPKATEVSATDGAQRWAFVPILISNAETGVQVGALVMRFLNPGDTADNPSTVELAARVSQKSQMQVDVVPEWYLDHNRLHIVGDLDYIRWPADFYGIGNGSDIPIDSADAYLAQGFSGDLTAEREILPKLFLGPRARFNYEDISSKSPHALLIDTVPGKDGGLVSGLGGVLTYDDRDAIYWARRGGILRAKGLWYRSWWGSDFDYDAYCLEARRFFPVSATGALGFAATFELHDGDVPFRELSTANGDQLMRGLVRGKYRDLDMLILQAEYKSYLPDWDWLSHPWVRNRIGWAVFAEAGQVAHSPGDISWEGYRAGYGIGLRYAMNPAQRLNIRADLGFVDNGIAPAIDIKEAF